MTELWPKYFFCYSQLFFRSNILKIRIFDIFFDSLSLNWQKSLHFFSYYSLYCTVLQQQQQFVFISDEESATSEVVKSLQEILTSICFFYKYFFSYQRCVALYSTKIVQFKNCVWEGGYTVRYFLLWFKVIVNITFTHNL